MLNARFNNNYFSVARAAAVLALVGLLAAGCSLPAGYGGRAAEAGAGDGQGPGTSQPQSTGTPAPEDATSGGTSVAVSDAQANKAPQDLDIEMRHPSGVTLRVTGLEFTGHDILVGAEVVNGARIGATFHRGNVSRARLRLVDADGNEYNFIETEDRVLKLQPGESLDGTLAFRGPLLGNPDQLWLITNVGSGDIATFDIDAESDSLVSTMFPSFVVPLDLA